MASLGGFFKAALPYLSAGMSLIPGGGPAVQILSGVVSKVTGQTVKPEDLQATINTLATTEAGRIQLQQIDNEYTKAMQELKFDTAEKLLEMDNADRASARTMQVQTRSWVVPTVACIFVTGFFLVIGLKIGHVITSADQTINDLITTLRDGLMLILAYYFGSSAGSAAKTELLAKAPPIQGGK